MAVNTIQFTPVEIRIAKFLFKHYKERFNPRQLARLLDINHAHANKLCNELIAKNLLVKEQIGNAIYYTYNYQNNLSIKFMEYLLSQELFPKWLLVVTHCLEKFRPYIHSGLVFGSSIKNKDFNDIDILLIYDKDKAKQVQKIKDEIRKSQLTDKPIRYVDETENDIISNKEDDVLYSIMSDNLVFHNPEKYVELIEKCLK